MTPVSAQPGPAAVRHRSPVLDDALAFRLHRTNRLLRTHLARFLDRHVPGISPEQWFILARRDKMLTETNAGLARPTTFRPCPSVLRVGLAGDRDGGACRRKR